MLTWIKALYFYGLTLAVHTIHIVISLKSFIDNAMSLQSGFALVSPPAASDDDVYNFHTVLLVAALLLSLDTAPTLSSARQQLHATSQVWWAERHAGEHQSIFTLLSPQNCAVVE